MSARFRFVGVMFALAAMGCEPCAGTVACTVPARLAIEGTLLDDATGRPVSGATVDFVRTGGLALEHDSVRSRTNDDGLYRIEVHAGGVGDVVGDLVVRFPGGGGYRVPSQTLQSTARAGEARVFPPWSTRLRLPDLGLAFLRGFPPANLAGAEIEFQPTGGPALSGLTNGVVYRTTTDSTGFFLLFGSTLEPQDGGDVVGNLVITQQSLVTVHENVRIPVRHDFHPAATLRIFGVGPSLSYHLEVNRRGRNDHVGGVRIEFRKTGGVNVVPADWSATTDPNGRVAFPVRALESGVVTGDIKVIPPPPWKTYDVIGMEFPTFDQDGAILFGTLGVGPGLPYYVVVRKNGVPKAGVTVEFRRTGGIFVNPQLFSSVTNDSGMVMINPIPATEGDVTADITVRPPSPDPAFVVRNALLTALDADRPGGRVLLGDWDIASPPASIVRRP